MNLLIKNVVTFIADAGLRVQIFQSKLQVTAFRTKNLNVSTV